MTHLRLADGRLDLTLQLGLDWDIVIDYSVDLTGYTSRWRLVDPRKPSPLVDSSGTAGVTLTSALVSGTTRLTLHVPATVTAALPVGLFGHRLSLQGPATQVPPSIGGTCRLIRDGIS